MTDEINLPIVTSTGLRWCSLLKIMAEHGYYLDNYPNGVCLPGSSLSDDMTRALRYIPSTQLNILIKAMKATDQGRRCGFRPHNARTSQDIKGMSIRLPCIIYAHS